jgi:hypothetical protein
VRGVVCKAMSTPGGVILSCSTSDGAQDVAPALIADRVHRILPRIARVRCGATGLAAGVRQWASPFAAAADTPPSIAAAIRDA